MDTAETCSICFDGVLGSKTIFGMLSNCNHCFCISCIRIWRQRREFNLEIRYACPVCRVVSEYVYPIKEWITDKEEKERYITRKNNKMKKIDCKYFKRGRGRCPFGNKCLFRHNRKLGLPLQPISEDTFFDEQNIWPFGGDPHWRFIIMEVLSDSDDEDNIFWNHYAD